MNILKKVIEKLNNKNNNIVIKEEESVKKEKNLEIEENTNEKIKKLKAWIKSLNSEEVKKDNYKELINKVNKIIDNDNDNDNDLIVINYINTILEKEENYLKENTKKYDKIKDTILNIKKILKKIDILNEIEEESINKEIISYEVIEDINYTKKIITVNEILIDIGKESIYEILKNNLGNIVNDFEVKIKPFINEYLLILKESNSLKNDAEIFKDEVNKFDSLIKSITVKGQVEFNNQYSKLKNKREKLVVKKDKLDKEEEHLNEKINKILNRINEILLIFEEYKEYILIYLDEEKTIIENKLNTYTKDNKLKDINNNQDNILKLNKLLQILSQET